MKICFITNTIFNLGGVQRVVSVLASALSEFHEVHVLCTMDDYDINRKIYNLSNEVKVVLKGDLFITNFNKRIICKLGKIINNRTMLLNKPERVDILTEIYFPTEVKEKFISFLNSSGYDVVIGVEGYYSLLLGCISDMLNMKVIGWQHNSYDGYLNNPHRYHWHQDELFNKLIPKLNKYIVLTDYDKEMFLKWNNLKCDVIYNPKSFESSEKSKLQNKIFLAAGRFTYQKGFDLLIDSFAEFCRYNNEWKLMLVGAGEEENNLRKRIKKYGLEARVELHGFTDKIKEYLLNSSALLLSSRWEGMPMIVLEAMEMAVPIISYKIPAAEQLINHGHEGYLVDNFDIKSFAEEMLKLAGSYELRLRLSEKALERSKNFCICNIVEKWRSMLETLK
ncbi:glycosyltransferase [Clostridium thermarum]|uniref:glycosyltransferase n=1 Tax=Clostridium thermarum TaxID=1716543 RepID=UPI0013D18B92|nr:glycosyltransferase [Clostridium thermarum]